MQMAPSVPMPVPDWQQLAVAVHGVPTGSHVLPGLPPESVLVPASSLPPDDWSMQTPSEQTRVPLQSASDAHRSPEAVAQAAAPAASTSALQIHFFDMTAPSNLKT